MKQNKLIFNFFVNRNWLKLTDSRKRAKILADNRKNHHPIETLYLVLILLVSMAIAWLSKIKSQVRVKAYKNVKTGKGLPVIRL